MNEFDTITTNQMSESEIEHVLEEHGHGVLALAKEDTSYAVPMSFAYSSEDECIYLYALQFGNTSKKIEFLDRTETATFVVYSVESRNEWRSVIVTGTASEIEEAEFKSISNISNEQYVDELLKESAWFPMFESPMEPITDTSRYMLAIEEKTGLQGGAYQ